MARKQWRCFHCDEVFTSRKWAAEHFGFACDQVPACKIAAYEGHLVTYIRKLEADNARYRAEDSDVLRSLYSATVDQANAVRRAEERGYDKGVQDMKAQGYCAEPNKHAA